MPSVNQEIKRRELIVFYVLDTSGSMNEDGKLGILNESMRETVEVLRTVAKNNADAEIKIAVLQFNSGAQWVTDNGPVYLEDFIWNDLKAEGLTDIGMAMDELHDKLSREKFLKSEVGQFLPIIIFMSDGFPTDNWEKSLKQINTNNRWFKYATKIAFGLGDAADEYTLGKIVGNSEAVVKTNDLEKFKTLIKIVSVTASKVTSSSRTSGQQMNSASIIRDSMQQAGLLEEPIYIDEEDGFDPHLNSTNMTQSMENNIENSNDFNELFDDDDWN